MTENLAIPSHVADQLDNPFWSALNSRHLERAIVNGRARRYPAPVAPFAGIEDASDESRSDLEALISPGETIGILGIIPGALDRWQIQRQFDIYQYVWDGSDGGGGGDAAIEMLGESDLDQMLALAALVYPAYFRRETAALGPYFGVKAGGELCAMAGIRMAVEGGQEISAVCTHPEHRGKGLASQLTRHLVRHIVATGDVPYLHTEFDNTTAQSVYEKLGFHRRAILPFRVMTFAS